MNKAMAKLDQDLPPHCQIKKRGGGKYYDVYFMPHPKDRPEGWPATLHLGRTDRQEHSAILDRARQTHDDYLNFFHKAITGEDLARRSGTLPDVIRIYRTSPFFTSLTAGTQKDYERYLKEIESWSARKNHPHIKEMTVKSAVKFLNRYEGKFDAQKKAKNVLSKLFATALREGFVDRNIIDGIELHRRTKEKRALVIWEERHVEAFITAAIEAGKPSIGRALIMALETSQRRGDVLKMQKPRDYDPRTGLLKYRQSKTKKIVTIPATKRLRAALADIPAEQIMLFLNEDTGNMWNAGKFSNAVREIADAAGLKKHIFAHTRHSAILYLHRAGCDAREIAANTGHSLKTVTSMLDNHYLETRDREVARQAVAKLEKYREEKSDKKVRQRVRQKLTRPL